MKRPITIVAALAVLFCAGASAIEPVTYTGNQTVSTLADKIVTITGKAEIHVTSGSGLTNAKVNLKGNDAWLYLDAIKPTYVIAYHLDKIKVDGEPADIATNVRLAQYLGGTVLIPHGYDTYSKALTVYSKKNFEGDSREVAIETYHSDLGEFDNNIRSFILKKGFQACFANNSDGSGFSRVYIADTEDLKVSELPEGFVTTTGSDKAFISFIRVTKHQWVSKKGWCGWNQNVLKFTNGTHSYGWSADYPGDEATLDREFVPQRHHRGWPSFESIKKLKNVSHLLADNEPDNQNDAAEMPSTPLQIIRLWPEYVKSGLRVGSPAPTSIGGDWLTRFFNLIDSLNYRCDFVVYHQYEATTDFASRVSSAVSKSKNRPVWITEWNNGANWTTESWPDDKGPRRDAHSELMYYKKTTNDKGEEVEVRCEKGDAGAYTKEVSRPLTKNNANKQLEFMKTALANQDALDKLERLHFYNAVQDARAVEIEGKLTPAGEYFAGYNAKIAYTKKSEYVHSWKIAPPLPEIGYSEDYKSCRLSWYDHNGETGKSYTVSRRDGTSGTWTDVATLRLGTDYQAGETVVFEDKINMADARQYRVVAASYAGKSSLYSRINTIYRDKVTGTPVLEAIPSEPSAVTLTWTPVNGAHGYCIEYREADDAEYKVATARYNNEVDASFGSLTYKISGLKENHDYWVRVGVVTNAPGEFYTDVVKVHTPSKELAPDGVVNFHAASGDNKVILTWDKTYQTAWDVQRADAANGPWTDLKTNVTAATYTDATAQNDNTYYYRLLPKRTSLGKILPGDYCKPVAATPQAGNFINILFNEGQGLTARDFHTANHASLKGHVEWTTDRNGFDKHAVSIKGSGEGYIALPAGILENMKDFTIAFWWKYDGETGRIFDFGKRESESMLFDYGKNNANGFRYKLRNADSNVNVDFNNSVKKGEWTHICLTQKGGELSFYLDGEKVGSASGQPQPNTLGTTYWNYLGRSMWSSDAHPDYSYDDLYIYNHAINANQVKALMSKVTSVDEIEAAPISDGLHVYADGHAIVVMSDAARTVNVYTLEGALVRTLAVDEGLNTFDGFDAGIYIVGSHKVVVK